MRMFQSVTAGSGPLLLNFGNVDMTFERGLVLKARGFVDIAL